MSLGIHSFWRARRRVTGVLGLLGIPRGQPTPSSPFWSNSQLSSQRWLSAAPPDTTPPESANAQDLNKPDLTVRSESWQIRAILRRVITMRADSEPAIPALVKRPVTSSSRYKSRRGLRKQRKSAAKQHLNDQASVIASKPDTSIESTAKFMLHYTHKYGDMLSFQIIIGRGVAAEARELLSGTDMHLSRIRQKNGSRIWIDKACQLGDAELVLNLSGPETAVRNSLVDVVNVVGKITAVRLPSPTWKMLLEGAWHKMTPTRPEVRFLDSGEALDDEVPDDKTLIVQAWGGDGKKFKEYWLTVRAEEIPRPAEWTKESFERYVAALVYSRVQPHRANVIYPKPPGHRETVISMLVGLFASTHVRSVVSASALKMALTYMQSSGRGFRQAAQKIFNQAELFGYPMDTDLFHIFLVGASKDGDLYGFNSILRMMVRKHHRPQSSAWTALMEMVQDVTAQRWIVASLRRSGLNRNPSVLRVVGRKMAVANLIAKPLDKLKIEEYVHQQDKKYGVGWLDTVTLDMMLDVLGAQGRRDMCNALLDLVSASDVTTPSPITLNTMLTHSRRLPDMLAILRSMPVRWPRRVGPTPDTYHLLYRAAWTRCCPNMLRVTWRYAASAKMTTPKMRYALTRLLRQEHGLSKRRSFLKTWEDVIFGRAELEELRALHGDKLRAGHVLARYAEQDEEMQPEVDFATKLGEAELMDRKIHRLTKEGVVLTVAMRNEHTVDIPLRPRDWLEERAPSFYVEEWMMKHG
ncbi:hypothetical protein GGS23DRAFT_584168 [Durotheca rogersii]|uniref:uncharacterized protein n=1 Tax=Durotheca rogersii TaxID=419775 RepID=UPI00221FC877|nr:uncharacterized protein GGS23DRAFT_584168 [Durotheca rogersii]KAI5859716.1 hypothetical protein GGS23DRAFT_584168 [Durotheca rogersii]